MNMNKNEVKSKVENFAKNRMRSFDPGHDWWHIVRVRRMAKYINSVEKTADPFTLDVAAILHDVADSKFKILDYNEIEVFLSENGLDDIKGKVLNAIRNLSFSNKNPEGDLTDPVLHIL